MNYDYIVTYGKTQIGYTSAVEMWREVLFNNVFPVEIKTDGKTRLIMSATADDLPISEFDFSVRAWNILRRANLLTMRDVREKAQKEGFANLPNCGKKTRREIYKTLERLYVSSEYTYYEARDNGYEGTALEFWGRIWEDENIDFVIQD